MIRDSEVGVISTLPGLSVFIKKVNANHVFFEGFITFPGLQICAMKFRRNKTEPHGKNSLAFINKKFNTSEVLEASSHYTASEEVILSISLQYFHLNSS